MKRSQHPVLRRLQRNWLADAEWSVSPGATDRAGLSLFFTDPFEWEAFLELGYVGQRGRELERDMRARFDLAPRVWVKLHLQDDVVAAISHYFVVDPSAAYPISTLRLGLRRLGLDDASRLEGGLRPALERDDTLWAMIAKGERPRVSCRVERSVIPDLVRAMEQAGLSRTAAWVPDYDRTMEAGPYAYVSLDLDSGDVALDYEDVGSVPAPARALWGSEGERRYLKVRQSDGQLGFSVYRPLSRVLAAEDRTDDPRETAKRYYDEAAEVIHRQVGTVYQAGAVPGLVGRIGIQPGDVVVDAGAGVGGPATEMAASAPGCFVLAMTLSASQASIAEPGPGVRMVVGDYHEMPVADSAADRMVFLESLGYAREPRGPLGEAVRVLRPGGAIYVKDVFVRDGELSPEERLDLEEFDEVYGQRTPSLASVRAALEAAGFVEIESTCLDDQIRMDGFYGAMFEDGRLNEFGRRHYRRFGRLPVRFWEIRARKPV